VSLYVKAAVMIRRCILFLCFGPFDLVDIGTIGVVVSAFKGVGLYLVVSLARRVEPVIRVRNC
jgi:hypothetical protein